MPTQAPNAQAMRNSRGRTRGAGRECSAKWLTTYRFVAGVCARVRISEVLMGYDVSHRERRGVRLDARLPLRAVWDVTSAAHSRRVAIVSAAHLGCSDGLCEVGVHSGVETPFAVALDGRGGQGDDAEVADVRLGRLSDELGRLAAGARWSAPGVNHCEPITANTLAVQVRHLTLREA